MPSSLKPHNFFADDFNDNTTGPRWQLLQVNGATASETNQRLQVVVPNGSGWAEAGYVTVDNYTLNEHIVKVSIPSRGNLNEMTLQICTTTTSSDPCGQNNWYRMMKTGDSSFLIQRRISGGSVETLQTFTSSSQQLVIRIQEIPDGVIQFYDDSNLSSLRYSQNYALPTYNCYVYVFTSSQRDSASGTGAFDDFAISPVIRQLSEPTHDFNCYSGATNQGSRGVTIWGPIDLPSSLSPNGGISPDLLFTPTQPKGYLNKDFCNVTFRIHTESSSTNPVIGPIIMKLYVHVSTPPGWNQLGAGATYYISKIAGHDVTQTIDLAPTIGYNDTERMYITFTNNDDQVHVWIKDLQIVRGYAMYPLPNQGSCPGDQTQDGSSDFTTRHDHPCNYETCGGLSYTGFIHDNSHFQQIVNGNQTDGTILRAGTT